MKLNVAIVFGGKSTEHEVSVISALQAIENIDKEKYNVLAIYMDKQGDFYFNKDNLLNDSKNYKDLKALINNSTNVHFVKIKNNVYIKELNKKLFGGSVNEIVDVVFPIVHGTNVEDGNLQGFFHTLNVPVVGPDTLAAAISMDKYVMKEYWKALDIPVIDAIRIDRTDMADINTVLKMIEEKIKYPVIVKPINLGSSIGIKKASNSEELKDALDLAFTFADFVLVEKAISNMREINCAVLGDKFSAMCSELEEPFGNDEILSFADKYMSGSKGGIKGGSKKPLIKNDGNKVSNNKLGGKVGGMASLKRKIPAELDNETAYNIKQCAKKIFKYLGCSGVARIDFIIDKDNNKFYANEINSIPGSLSYYLFEPLGLSYKDMIDKLINIAIENFKREEKLSFTFENNLLS